MKPQTTLVQQMQQHAPDSIALIDGAGTQISYAALIDEILNFTKELNTLNSYGMALAMDNGPAQVVADLAARMAGLWTLPLPPFFTTGQSNNAVTKSGCPLLLTDQVQLSSNVLSQVTLLGKPFFLCKTDCPVKDKTQPGTALVTFTSGTTGAPKGLCLSEEHLMQPAMAIADRIVPLGIKKHLCLLPQSILLEQVAGIYASLYAGVSCVIPSLTDTGIMAQPPAASALGNTVIKHQANSLILVPELLQALVQFCQQQNTQLPSLKYIAVGGSKVGAKLLADAEHLNLPVFEGYGLSEAGSVVTINTPQQQCKDSVGKPLPHQQVSIAADGEILLLNPGYLGYCESTQQPSSPLFTGDIGYLNNKGFLFINGRKKNILITSMGRNVSPEWVENLLQDSDQIAQSLVYGDGEKSLSALIVSAHTDEQIDQAISSANADLPNYARIANWKRVTPFTPLNGHLTANGKLCRALILQTYCDTSENSNQQEIVA